MTDDFNKLIDQVVEERTLSLEAVDALKVLRDQANDDANTVIEQELKLERLAGELVEAERSLGEMDRREAAVAEDRVKLLARHDEIHTKEVEQAADKATAATFRECFGLVFRNQTISREILRSATGQEPDSTPGSYGVVATSQTESVTETEESK